DFHRRRLGRRRQLRLRLVLRLRQLPLRRHELPLRRLKFRRRLLLRLGSLLERGLPLGGHLLDLRLSLLYCLLLLGGSPFDRLAPFLQRLLPLRRRRLQLLLPLLELLLQLPLALLGLLRRVLVAVGRRVGGLLRQGTLQLVQRLAQLLL